MSEVESVTLSANGKSVKIDGDGLKKMAETLKEATGKKGAVPVEILETPVFKKAAKEFGEKEAKAILEKTNDELKMVIAENVLRKEELVGKLKENKEYAKAKDVVTTLEGGMKSTMIGSNLAAKVAKLVLKMRRGD